MPRTRSGGGYSMAAVKPKQVLDDQEDSEEEQEDPTQGDQYASTSSLANNQKLEKQALDDQQQSTGNNNKLANLEQKLDKKGDAQKGKYNDLMNSIQAENVQERSDMIARLKRVHFYATHQMFTKIDLEGVNTLVDHLYDLHERIGDNSAETVAIFDKVTEINQLMRDYERQEKLDQSHHASRNSLASIIHSPTQVIMTTANDPNLVVENWDGTASGYYEFERSFLSTYVQNSAYTAANRFAAFSKLVGPKGRDLIRDLDRTADGLDTAMKRVKDRFAHKQQIRTEVERKLANLPFAKSEFDAYGLGAIISAAESSIKVLEQAGIDRGYVNLVVFGTIGSRLPRPMFRRFLRKHNFEQEIDQLIDFIRDQVEENHKSEQAVSTALSIAGTTKARINAVASSPNSKPQTSKSPNSPNVGVSITRNSHQPRNNRSGRPPNQPITCRLCEGNHHTFSCSEGTVESRKKLAVSKQFCFRCVLRHPGVPCRSTYICPCGGAHTNVLCPNGGVRTPPIPSNNSSSNQAGQGPTVSPTQTTNSNPNQTQPKSGITMSIPSAGGKAAVPINSQHLRYSRPELLTTYYETVVVRINNEMVRVQLDSGAGRTLILQELADRLKLRLYSRHNLKLGGFDGLSSQSSERLVTAKLQSINSHHSFRMVMCVTPRIDHRPRAVSRELWNALQSDGYELSDAPEYDQLPISIVVGAEYYRLLFQGNYISYSDDLSVRPSLFGWVLTGTTEEERPSSIRHHSPYVGLINSHSMSEGDGSQQPFDFSPLSTPSTDAKLALANTDFLFATNSSNDRKLEEEFNQEFISKKVNLRDRRYSVKLEWIEPIEMGSNKQIALTRHHRLERSLEARQLTLAYNKELGEMVTSFTEPAIEPCKSRKCYYMPHHPVVRLDKDTTKLRVVFDASSSATGTKSLNENLFKGVVKWDLLDVLLSFRFGQYALIADIEKAFLQIEVDPDDRDAFRFWWKDEAGQLTTRRFKVVPFGTSISPYLLYIVFSHLFATMENKYPDVVPVIKNRMYVDDVIISFETATPEDLNKFRTMSVELFQEASMNLRKFRTNCQELDEQWAGPDRAPTAKVLGHAWTVLADIFGPSIDVSQYQSLASITKREFTAFVQSVYNPTGIVAPFNLKLKLALRELWALKLRWDEPIPESNLKDAQELIREAELVNSMVAPRNVLPDDGTVPSLRIYADASEKAVAVVAYCCSSKGNFHLLAKTKLARSATMPELELDALGMAAAVAHYLSLVHKFSRVVICGDSKCNLQRLQQHPNKQKPSIALRIRKISKLAPTATFRHVSTKENLADIASRGSTMKQLVKTKQWLEAQELPASTQFEHTISSQMMTVAATSADDPSQCACIRFTSYKLAVGTYRLVGRWLKKKTTKYDDVNELDLALILLIRDVQQTHFHHHITSVDEKQNISFDKQSILQNFSAHLDQYGLIRLRTRLEQTVNFSYEEVHPIILPPHCQFSRLVIANTHHQLFHPGVDRTCSSIRERFFIINQRRMVKHFVNSCIICRRKRHIASNIRHGPVPPFRYDVSSPPFTNTGIDLFGPVKVPMENDAKVYGVIYVCATSRLVFIDAIPDMTAESVFTSVTHFVARNGLPRMFYSDNGKQLIKVKNDLQKYLEEMALKRPDQEYRVQWQHLTAHSPWKGGFYERLNRSIKEALATFSLDRSVSTQSIAGRVNGKRAKLTLDQLKHVFAEIEAMINNRPLFEHEGKVIRPIDFRAGQGSLQMPIACNLPARYQKPNIIRDYKAFQTKVNHYRKLWKSNYILELRNFHQHSEKQKIPRRFEVGDVVHVKAPSTRLDQWPLGVVVKVFDGSDGISRSVKVRTLSRGNVVEEMKDVRNLIPVEANQERHEQPEPKSASEPELALDDQLLDLPDTRLRPTASRVARLRPPPEKKESLEKLAKKWSRALQLKQKDAVYRQRLRDRISEAIAKGQTKDSPQSPDLEHLAEFSLWSMCIRWTKERSSFIRIHYQHQQPQSHSAESVRRLLALPSEKILSNHASTLLYYHDPISSKGGQTKVRSQNGSKWNTAFLFPLLSVIISILYGTVFMVYSETGGQLDWETLKTCPVMMNHQAFPRVIWAQDDFAWAVAASVATALYAISLRNPYTLDRYQVACYLVYIVTLVPTLSFFWRSYFTYVLVNCTVFHIYIIQLCSRVVQVNGAIERANRRFYLACFCISGAFKTKQAAEKASKSHHPEGGAAAEQSPSPSVLYGSAGQLLITSKTFYLLSSYTAAFFLMIFKEQQQ
ncbi:hypothetical protein TYRP_022936 [Tyrophagus putrescentiae]|nr:hypothetical protein TYRP_022936 [Tyrophagus putrescentiae]